MPTTVRERSTARRAAASSGRRAKTCGIPPTRCSPSVCRRPAPCMSTACKAKASGRTGPATNRRSRAISSATSTNPRMTLRGAFSATSRSNVRAQSRLAPAVSRRPPRLPSRPSLPRRRRPLPFRLVRPQRRPARRPPNRRARRRQTRPEIRPGRRRLRPLPAAPIRCGAPAPGRASRAARDPTFRLAENAASSANWRRAAPVRIRPVPPERHLSGPATSAATPIKSIAPQAARKRAAAARLSTAAACRRRQTANRDRQARDALSAPSDMSSPASIAASRVR
jgi:hypothetical protein